MSTGDQQLCGGTSVRTVGEGGFTLSPSIQRLGARLDSLLFAPCVSAQHAAF